MEKIKQCEQIGCKISEGGNCLEGLEIKDCPHFYWGKEVDNVDVNSITDDQLSNLTNQVSNFKIFSGSELTLEEIDIVTNKYNCAWVVILGEYDCGKTTLLSSIFDLLQTGFFRKYLFAGSLTQIGFEERSHLSRTISGNDKPDTERTKSLEFRLLHLALRNIDSKNIQNFILSDISGETIRQARNSAVAMQARLSLIKNVDFIFYMFDGEKLMQGAKATTLFNAALFLDSAIQNGILSKKNILHILISKWDILSTDPKFDMEKDIIQPMKSRFLEKLSDIQYYKIAARPDESNNEIDHGFGIEKILDIIHFQNQIEVFDEGINLQKDGRYFETLKIKVDD